MKPSQEFTFKILSDEDFDKLPYDDARNSLGLSVMETKTAYIRKTGVKELDMGTIQHEFDELMQQTSPHEINGIRYKKFKDFIRTVIGAVPFIGGPINQAIFGAGDRRTQERLQGEQTAAFSKLFGSAGPSQATQAFAPQAAQPLGQEQFNTSLSNLDKNREATKQSVFSQFRGQSPRGSGGNTAFQTALSNASSSSDLARNSFLEDQRKLGSTFA